MCGRIWTAIPCVVVEDSPSLVALWIPPSTRWMRCQDLDGNRPTPRHRAECNWVLREDTTWLGTGMLRLTEPGKPYSLWVFWKPDYREIDRWYVNLETPQRRTPIGFDYLDQLLDVVVAPDRASWQWKDEDEVQEALELNLMTRAEADALRDAGLEAVAALQSGRRPFQPSWAVWRPGPSWTHPALPEGWDRTA
jgi:predicted RNA-binding protein associated with RNAse of E/G family